MDVHDGPGEGHEEPPAALDDGTTRGDADPGSGPGSGSGTGTGPGGPATMIVEMGGETRELPAEHDYTGDGRPDAAAETSDGRVIVFADTEDNETGAAEPDGRADEAYVVDKRTGRVVGAAHVDPQTGEWVEGVGHPAPEPAPDPAPTPAPAEREVDS